MKSRNYGIDVLRLCSTLGVVVLHVFGSTANEIDGGINGCISSFFQVLCMCSVNLFGLITGYLCVEKNQHRYFPLLRIIFQVLFYSIIISILVKIIRPEWIVGTRSFMESLFPFGSRLWYITAYIFVYCMIPYINIFIASCDKITLKKFLMITFFLLSCVTTFGLKDYFVINMGYSCFWILYMYFIGAYIRKYNICLNKSYILILYLFTFSFLFGIKLFLLFFYSNVIEIFYTRFIAYCSPFVLVNSICVFCFMKDIDVKNIIFKRILEKLSLASLGVYIIHAHGVILDNVIYKFMPKILGSNAFVFLFSGLFFSILVYVICILIDIVRQILEKYSKFIILESKISERIDILLGCK